MLEAMLEGWRGKRVLIVGKPDGLCAFLTAMLEEIGARLMRVGDRADAQALCRALTAGRIGAVILPEEMTGRDLPERLAATLTLIQEIREAGVPLLLALSDAAVYPSSAGKMNETAAIGGRTREGLEASILQMAILGAARGLTGDAVRTMLIRHALRIGHDADGAVSALHLLLVAHRHRPDGLLLPHLPETDRWLGGSADSLTVFTQIAKACVGAGYMQNRSQGINWKIFRQKACQKAVID